MLVEPRILRCVGAISLLLLVSPSEAVQGNPDPPYLTELEAEVLHEMNLARTNPRRYAELLDARRKYFRGKRFERPNEVAMVTEEGVSAVDEAIGFLRRAEPISALRPSKGMSRAARDHVRDQASSGSLGHRGSDGSQVQDRANRYGKWSGKIGENVSYGHREAREVVVALVVDDGVASRGHRRNLFDAAFRVVGVACGQHERYRAMCVTALAGDYAER